MNVKTNDVVPNMEFQMNKEKSVSFYSSDQISALNAVLEEKKRQVARVHRAVEKKRRDRLNKQLQRLRSLLPLKLNGKSKNRIEKVEILELAIESICRMRNELNNEECRNERTSISSSFSSSSSSSISSNDRINYDNEMYYKGLKDGMDTMFEYMKRFDQLQAKINEKILKHADAFRKNFLNSVDGLSFSMASQIYERFKDRFSSQPLKLMSSISLPSFSGYENKNLFTQSNLFSSFDNSQTLSESCCNMSDEIKEELYESSQKPNVFFSL